MERLRELAKKDQYLRISVTKTGCAGNAYKLDYLPLAKRGKWDEVVEQDGVTVLLESRSLMPLIGSRVDYAKTLLTAEFKFANPNAGEQCGCGESFQLQPPPKDTPSKS